MRNNNQTGQASGFVLLLVVVLFVVIGACIYMISSGVFDSGRVSENEIRQYEITSDSDEAEAIENDLEQTEFGDMDEELGAIEKEINESYEDSNSESGEEVVY